MKHRPLVIAAFALAANLAAPVMPAAFADGGVPPVGGVGVGTQVGTPDVGTPDLTGTIDAAKKKACVPQGLPSDFGAWSGELWATVHKDPLTGTIQYVWETYDSSVPGSAQGWVPDDGCANAVRIVSQITDTSPATGCNATQRSNPSQIDDAQHVVSDGRKYVVATNPDPFTLAVVYYGNDTLAPQTTTASGPLGLPDIAGARTYCIRDHSSVDVQTTASYRNNLGQYVVAACAKDEYAVTATPNGPLIDYLSTVDC